MIFTDDIKLDNFLYALLAGRVSEKGVDNSCFNRVNVSKHSPYSDPWKDKYCVYFLLNTFGVSCRNKSYTYKRKRK